MASWKLEHLKYVDKFAISQWLVTSFRSIFFTIDWILDLTLGCTITKGTSTERNKAKGYENSAQIVDILFRGTYSIVSTHQTDNFLYRHNKYVHPNFVLENDNCTLMGVTPTHAFFCLTNDPQKNVFRHTNDPFMYITQFVNAEQLLLLPLELFHRLADELGDPDNRKVAVLDMTGRCGSTLLCQVTARVPKLRTLSEPWAPMHTHGHHLKNNYSKEELKQVMRSCFRILCKPENDTEIQYIFIKVTCLIMHLQPMIQEMFPKFKYLFITRHYKPSLTSWQKLSSSLPQFFMRTPLWIDFYFNHISFPSEDLEWISRVNTWMRKVNTDQFPQAFTLCYAANMHCYIKNRLNYDHVILYEDYLAEPRIQTEKLFDALEIGHEYVDVALEALKHDSQRGLFGGIGSDKFKLSDKLLEQVDDVLRECKVPVSMGMSLAELKRLLWPKEKEEKEEEKEEEMEEKEMEEKEEKEEMEEKEKTTFLGKFEKIANGSSNFAVLTERSVQYSHMER